MFYSGYCCCVFFVFWATDVIAFCFVVVVVLVPVPVLVLVRVLASVLVLVLVPVLVLVLCNCTCCCCVLPSLVWFPGCPGCWGAGGVPKGLQYPPFIGLYKQLLARRHGTQ